MWSYALFSLPNNSFCVDNVRRIYILVNSLGLKGLKGQLLISKTCEKLSSIFIPSVFIRAT